MVDEKSVIHPTAAAFQPAALILDISPGLHQGYGSA